MRALPAAAGQTHDETRADPPEERLGEPIEGHDPQIEAGEVTPEVSAAAPDATSHDERPKKDSAE